MGALSTGKRCRHNGAESRVESAGTVRNVDMSVVRRLGIKIRNCNIATDDLIYFIR